MSDRNHVVPTPDGGGNANRQRWLRRAFLAGAVADALALVPMLLPPMARLLWGFEELDGAYRFAMGYGASLMLGWTILLLWAYRRPVERAFVAALTAIVIYGLITTEVAAVIAGHLAWWRMLGTWVLQAGLLALFAGAYHHAWLMRRLSASPLRGRTLRP